MNEEEIEDCLNEMLNIGTKYSNKPVTMIRQYEKMFKSIYSRGFNDGSQMNGSVKSAIEYNKNNGKN